MQMLKNEDSLLNFFLKLKMSSFLSYYSIKDLESKKYLLRVVNLQWQIFVYTNGMLLHIVGRSICKEDSFFKCSFLFLNE